MSTRAWLWPVVVVAGAFAASCTSILGDFQPPGSTGQGGGGASSTSQSSSRSSSRASTGGSGGAPECKKDGDCMEPPQPCLLPFCDGGVCATKPVKTGEDSPKQLPGDCQRIVCDANGASHTVIDTSDTDDQKECTVDHCDPDGTPHHSVMNGSHCGSDGSMFCNSVGDCVECLSPSNCPGVGACVGYVCQTASCTDGVKNHGETDVDCGGASCPNKCDDGKHCDSGGDCESHLCQASHCRPATCANGTLDPAEADVDCGGPDCQPCGDGKKCTADSDCASNLCQAALCRVATCGNGMPDGDETDTDCGGSCQHCNTGQMCLSGTDCVSGTCTGGLCT